MDAISSPPSHSISLEAYQDRTSRSRQRLAGSRPIPLIKSAGCNRKAPV
jgi:hypothetical protein